MRLILLLFLMLASCLNSIALTTHNNHYFALEGNFGAGKTTLLKRLAEKYDQIAPVYEPVEKWQDVNGHGSIYDLYFKDTQRWALTMELYVLMSRVFAHKAIAEENFGKTPVIDHSIYADYFCWAYPLKENNTLSPIEWAIYHDMFTNVTNTIIGKPAGIIYLRTQPKTAHARALKRGRQEDLSIPINFWHMLHERHELLFEGNNSLIQNIPVLLLNGQLDYLENPEYLDEHVEKITSFIAAILNNQ